MSAEALRAAARLMRDRAEAANKTAGVWFDKADMAEAIDRADLWDTQDDPRADAEHIASWHPAVALAVADWLDGEADDHDLRVSSVNAIAEEQGWDHHVDTVWIDSAPLTVARAYLGESE